jgi:hypothetical protein
MEETKITPRRLARQMAKHQLDGNHVTGYNKPTTLMNGKVGPSTFAQNWKKLAIEAMKPRNKKGAKK